MLLLQIFSCSFINEVLGGTPHQLLDEGGNRMASSLYCVFNESVIYGQPSRVEANELARPSSSGSGLIA